MLVNLTEAAKLVGLSRSYFHKRYIAATGSHYGELSISEFNGKPAIDTSELMRVFGALKQVNTDNTAQQHSVQTHQDTVIVEILKQQLEDARQSIKQAQERERIALEREQALTNQVNKLIEANNMLLLEHKNTTTQHNIKPVIPKEDTQNTVPRTPGHKPKKSNITFADIMAKWEAKQDLIEQEEDKAKRQSSQK